MLSITIQRGAHEIGGNCVEIASDETRIILDLGMPLIETRNRLKRFDSLSTLRKTARHLLDERILPNVQGLYGTTDERPPDALLISHAHQDHYALSGYIDSSIPVYLSQEAKALIETSNLFLPIKAKLENCRELVNRKTVKIGDITVTPYLMDHSAFGAMAFLIESKGKKIFYSGDFRGHGRKRTVFEAFLRNNPGPVDCLLMEGTTLGRNTQKYRTEEELEKDVEGQLKNHAGIKLFCASPQNIDRMVTVFKAATRSDHLFVLDLYSAFLLDELRRFAKIPFPSKSFGSIRVVFTKKMMRHVLRMNRRDILVRFRPYEISFTEIERAQNVLIMIRASMLDEFRQLTLRGCTLIYSMFEGYWDESSFEEVRKFAAENQIEVKKVHTSGHASYADLRRFVSALKPKMLVPIHTFHPERYQEFSKNVRIQNDGVPFVVS